MHLAPVAIGFLVAMPALSGSLLRIPFAALVDTTGGRKPFLIPARHVDPRHGRAHRADVPALPRRDHRRHAAAPLPAGHPVRRGHRHLLGRHRAGLVLVPAQAAGQRSRDLRRHRQPCAGHLLLALARRAGGLGHRRVVPDLAGLPGDRDRALLRARPELALLPVQGAGLHRRAGAGPGRGARAGDFPERPDEGQPAAIRPHARNLAARRDLLHHVRRVPRASPPGCPSTGSRTSAWPRSRPAR